MSVPHFHPWHHIGHPEEESILHCVIEIPKGSKMKYELDKTYGVLRLDRVLYSSMHYPINYGFIPQTLDDDGDPLDILLFCSESILPMTMVRAKVIGVMQMVDSNTNDDKIIAVADNDISVNYINQLEDLPPHLTTELKDFFEKYKTLENKVTAIERFDGKDKAFEVIRYSQQQYQKQFGSIS